MKASKFRLLVLSEVVICLQPQGMVSFGNRGHKSASLILHNERMIANTSIIIIIN